MMIPEMLKNKCANATWSEAFPEVTMEAMIPVRVVPMLAPRVKGYICSKRSTPRPTKGVSVEVVMEDDWTTMVIPAPMIMATYPFMSVAL